ncbi:MAG: hypothetical protein ABSH25_18810 [Syntrophorhabdales bacterium]|jgi:hypothetical protein
MKRKRIKAVFNSEVKKRGWPDAGTCNGESKTVHFRQLPQEGGMKALPLDAVGKSIEKALISAEAGRDGTFSLFPPSTPQSGGSR